MKATGLLALVLAASLTMVGPARADDVRDDSKCKRVTAVGVGQDQGGGVTTATITRGGVLNGTTNALFVVAGAPPVFSFTGTITFTTKRGTLTVSPLSGTFNGVTGEFTGTGPIAGGTGKLAGSTGTLTFTGVEDFATGTFTETITGTLCRAGDGEDD